MKPSDAVVWVFLVVFAATAAIALASLVNWVRVERSYKNKLFTALVLQVVGVVVVFGKTAIMPPPPEMTLRETLVAHELGWDSQYAEKGWRTRLQFQDAGEQKLTMAGATNVVGAPQAGALGPVITWESTEPFAVRDGDTRITFKARRTYTQAALQFDPSLRWEIGKKTDINITLRLDRAVTGAARNEGSAETWGLVLTRAQR